jgi:hypothetical protein
MKPVLVKSQEPREWEYNGKQHPDDLRVNNSGRRIQEVNR